MMLAKSLGPIPYFIVIVVCARHHTVPKINLMDYDTKKKPLSPPHNHFPAEWGILSCLRNRYAFLLDRPDRPTLLITDFTLFFPVTLRLKSPLRAFKA